MLQLQTPVQAAQWLRLHVSGTLRTDSRRLQPGDGFIAWPGTALDARQFVAQALAQGAKACLVEYTGHENFALESATVASYAGLKDAAGEIAAEYFGVPSQRLAVLAVTGTNGKTSTTWWLAQALSGVGKPCGVVGTLGVGCPPDVVPTGLTTPDPVLLQATLQCFAQQGLVYCAMEASSIGIEEQRLRGTHIRVAVFTNFTLDHLDYHPSMEAYWAAKAKLFAWSGLEHAVINIDDPQGAVLADGLKTGPLDVWTVSAKEGGGPGARLQARKLQHLAQGLQFELVEGGVVVPLATRLVGSFNVSNLLGVIATMRCLGMTLDAAAAACAHLLPVPGRMESLADVGEPLTVVDYAHTPDALAQALAALRPMATQRGGQLWCVFGCGGGRDASKRPLMGAIAAQQADRVVLTSDNPRGEKPESIIAQILLGAAHGQWVEVQVDRACAIAEVVQRAHANDVILIAGKGHEDSQEIAGIKYPFLDREHASQALLLRQAAPQEARPWCLRP